jgi:transposase
LIDKGKLSQYQLKQINTVIDMINKLRRERERIYNQFERKRRPALINAVKYQETSPNDDPAIENLAD